MRINSGAKVIPVWYQVYPSDLKSKPARFVQTDWKYYDEHIIEAYANWHA